MSNLEENDGLTALVIGAGMAGLTAARELARAGLSVVVVEGGDRIGGRLRTIRDFSGQPIEAGAEFIHGNDAATWTEVRAAGLNTRPCRLVRDTMLEFGGRARWLPLALLHPGTWPAADILRSIGRVRPPDRSAREFLDGRRDSRRARLLAQMTLTAHLPGSIDEIGMLGLKSDGVHRLETGLNHRVVEGYDELARFVARDLDIRFGFVVETVQWNPDGVSVQSTEGLELSARTAVCTLPVGVLTSGAIRFEPELPESKRSALHHLRAGPVLKILLRFGDRFWPRRLAILACATGPLTLYWPIARRSAQDDPVLIAYATGPRATALAGVSEDEATAVAVRDLGRLFPKADVQRELVAGRRIDWTADPLARGGYSFVRVGGAGAREMLAAADTGPLLWAGAATESSPIAETVEAAYLSGLRAAREARRALGA
jgi:monoamine oxidase